MGTLFSLSKSATSAALDISEIALLLFGVLLVVGLVGEYAKSERWKRHVRIFEMFVIIGVAGELLADGGIFLFSRHLQTLANVEIASLNGVAEKERLARVKIEQDAANRDITPEDQKMLSSELSAFAGQRANIDVFPVTFEHEWIAQTLIAILTNAHWNATHMTLLPAPAKRRLSSNGMGVPAPFLIQGIWISATGDATSQTAATALFEALKSTVSPASMDHVPLPNPKNPRVWIYVGDKPTPLRSWVR